MSKLDLRGAFRSPKTQEAAEGAITGYVEGIVNGLVCPPSPFEVGKSYLIRTITMVDVGKIRKITGNFIVMEDASWIADTGRFHECLQKPDVFNEVEPFKHDLYISLNAIVDATPWPYTLPTKAK